MSTNTTAIATELYFDYPNSTLHRENQCTKLDPITSNLLNYFLDHPNQVLTRTELIEQVWQSNHVSDDAVNRAISVLRKTLGGQRDSYITTIPKTGYRFIEPIDIRQNTIIDCERDTSLTKSETDVPVEVTPTPNSISLPPIWYISVTLFVVMLVFFLMPSQQTTTVPSDAINIAVIPFVKMTDDANQQYFVDGLSEEVLNGLTRIDGLLVVERAASFAYRDKEIDIKQLAEALSVQYVLQGSVRKNANQLRITVKLIDAQSGVYLFSTIFERALDDAFAIQKEISQQVAAALKLSLRHSDENGQYPYSSALGTLDHISVEKLVIARAQINQYKEKPVSKALGTLQSLNRQFPGTPEIIGLQAYGNAILGSTAAMNDTYRRETEVNLAKQALALDPTNLDALTTLFYFYQDFADLREKAEHISQEILRHHPGKKSGYKLGLRLLLGSAPSCEALQNYIQSMPAGVYPQPRMNAINTIVSSCANPSPDAPHSLSTSSSDPEQQLMLARIIKMFGLNDDARYRAIDHFVQRNPNQRFLSEIYQQQLAMGAIEAASKNEALIDHSGGGYWTWLTTLYGYINHRPTVKTPHQFLEFTRKVFKNSADPYFVAALVLQHEKQKQDNDSLLTDYLANVPPFKVELFNRDETLGLMMLQYHSGQSTQSHNTANKLLNKLNQYQQQHPQAYRFWSMATYHFISAFYAGQWAQAEKILTTGFADNETYWQHDSGFSTVVLSPWKDHPLVLEYLKRIDTDRLRARQKFDLL